MGRYYPPMSTHALGEHDIALPRYVNPTPRPSFVVWQPWPDEKETAYRAVLAADAAWSAELRRIFGARAGDVRHTAEGRGTPGSTLRTMHDAFQHADDNWQTHITRRG